MKNITNKSILAAALASALAACGGGSDGGGSAGAGGSTVSQGTITGFGSVVVNGVHFDEAGANVSINDRPGAGDHKGLKIGMTVKIKGSTDGASGTATDIEAEHEVEGEITAVDTATNSFVVLEQTVYTDAGTLYDGIAGGFAGLTAGMKVEVYGLRDASGIHATLIEAEDSDFDEEVRGVVSDLTTDTFKIGDLTVHYDTTTQAEDGTLAADLKNGATVEVHFDSAVMANHATKIEFEDNEDDEFEAHDGDDTEVEGYVSAYDSATGTFTIGDVNVRTTSTTRFEGMGALANGVKVEAEGTMVNGVLVATEMSFE